MDRLTVTQTERDVVIARGTDAVEYLQTQLTQDVDALSIGESAWTFLLSPKSEVVVLGRVTKAGVGMVLIDMEPGYGAGVIERIDGFLFRTDVSFETTSWSGLSYRGPGSEAVNRSGIPIGMLAPWPGEEGVDLVGPDLSADPAAEEISAAEFDSMRIRVGWPSMADFDESTTPAMSGIVGHTVSFTKGCYTGQELVARTHYRDAAPTRRLVQVGFHPCAKPSVSDTVEFEGEEVGWLTTVSDHQPLALGYLKRAIVTPAEAIMDGTPICIGDLPATHHARKPTRETPQTVSPLSFG